jgi:hypothetical protein
MRGTTVLVVVGILLLGALAVADALRQDAKSTSAAASTEASLTTAPLKPPTLLETLRSEAVSGFVVYSDQDCRLHSLLLPRMIDDVIRDNDGSAVVRCRFEMDGGRIVREGQAPSDFAVRGGEIVAGGHVVLTHEELVRAAYRHPNLVGFDRSIPLRIKVTGLTGFGIREPIVGMAISALDLEPQYLAAVFEDGKVDAIAASFRGPYRHFFLSVDGALAGSEDGTVFTRTGNTIDPPQNVPAGRAVAFSPDDRWLAWLNGRSFFLVGSQGGGPEARIIRLPIAARDLVWQPVTSGTSIGPPIRR